MRGDDYDEQVITAAGLFVWEGYDFCVLPYRSKRSGRQDAITNFILDFKGNYPRAVELGIKLIVDALARFRNRLRTTNCQYVLAAPPHGVGKPKPPSEAACKALADVHWPEWHTVGQRPATTDSTSRSKGRGAWTRRSPRGSNRGLRA